ncbi:MAG: PspC domain-containing protein [Treponemataceae bacterium]
MLILKFFRDLKRTFLSAINEKCALSTTCYRLRSKKVVLGVCAGLAEVYSYPVVIMRGFFIALSFPFALSVVAYFFLALILPVED